MTEPQIIESDGKPAFVVLRYDDWCKIQELIEDAEDNAALDVFRAGSIETFPISVTDAILAGGNPARVYRRFRGLTLKRVAEACGITQPYLSQIETGRRKPTVDVLKKVAEALSVSIDDLI